MKRTYFPGIIDVVVVTDPAEIRTVSNESRLDRDFTGHVPIRNRQRVRKMLRSFSVNGRLFPTMLPRTDPVRAAAQEQLWARLNVKADEVRRGPADLELLAEWVRGIGTAEWIGLLVQQSVGRLFVELFTATAESWAAACLVLEAASSSNVLKMLGWRISRNLERAKALLASVVNGYGCDASDLGSARWCFTRINGVSDCNGQILRLRVHIVHRCANDGLQIKSSGRGKIRCLRHESGQPN